MATTACGHAVVTRFALPLMLVASSARCSLAAVEAESSFCGHSCTSRGSHSTEKWVSAMMRGADLENMRSVWHFLRRAVRPRRSLW